MRAYIHIPFCNQKCSYCKFALTPIFSEFQRKKYIHTLCQEIQKKISKYKIKNISSIYFGWWTPSILPIEEVSKILSLFPKNIPEITFESNPEDINEAYIDKLFSLGITRLSIGIQTLNEESLKEIERQWLCSIIWALESIKNTEVWKVWLFWNRKISINIDLILGLPKVKKWETLKHLIFLHNNYPFITHTSIYILEKWLYPKKWQKISISEDDITNEYNQIIQYLKSKKWNHYEISNFCKPGHECKHNMWYWNHEEYLWFWLAASEFLYEKGVAIRQTNSPSFSGYYKWNIFEKEFLNNEQLELEKLLFWLRTKWYQINPNISLLSQEKINQFKKLKFITQENNIIHLTEKWIPLIDYISEKLLL